MAFTQAEQVDFLWKKVIYGVTDTNNGGKAGPEETIGSPLPVFAKNILSQPIPTPAPGSTTTVVQYYGLTTLSAVHCTADPTVAGNKTWLATSTYGSLPTRLVNWIPPSVDASYLMEVFKNDPSVGGNMLNGTSSGYEWVFDYQAGVLTFPNTLPAGITNLYLVGYQYVGTTGLGGAGANIYVDQTIYAGSTVASGTVTLASFFTHTPQSNSVVIMFNGVRIDSSAWSNTGTDLVINVSNLPYDLEATDVISADYAFAGTG
jgi:hypothetical protein